MIPLVIVENEKRWPFELEGAEVVRARQYLVDPRYSELRGAAVFNVCRDYGYQSLGYYVSLLAAARGHRPLPSVATLQTLGSSSLVRVAAQDLDELVDRSLRPLKGSDFKLSVYFGRNVAARYDRLSRALFNQFPAPFLVARFVREEERWRLQSIRPVAGMEVPETHRPFVVEQARSFFAKPRLSITKPREYRYDLAVLWSDTDEEAPSNGKAIRKFIRAARKVGIEAEVLDPDDLGRIAEFDALFLRQTTQVNHYTYRVAQRAAAEGLVVIDHPEAIIRCTNKVYQAELFARHGIPCPRTLVVHSGNVDEVAGEIGLPCVLKRPDASFSQGVTRADTREDLEASLRDLLKESALVIAQEWAPTAYDWRIGVLERRALFAARYHMVKGHWQIAQRADASDRRYGRVEAVPVEEVPPKVLEAGVRAASLFGDGLFGVDVKDVDGHPMIVEVNDNPNIDAGYEDAVLKDELYLAVMRSFRDRLDARGAREGDR